MIMELEPLRAENPYVSYAYAYPHKSAYRLLEPPVPLQEAWAEERKDLLFLYVHVPFCEMRCGFCNLFTTANPADPFPTLYLDALEREAVRTREAVGPARFARLALGGGTPTYLDPAELARVFDLVEQRFGIPPGSIPVSVETSPATADAERLAVLRDRGVSRVSIGVQSFVETETAAAGRSQKTRTVEAALERIRQESFPVLNIDLIYGLPGQTVESWLQSLRAALRFEPEELYLYPLYVRPLTGLARRGSAGDQRLECYRAGRDLLLEQGYRQISMRMFRRDDNPATGRRIDPAAEDARTGRGKAGQPLAARISLARLDLERSPQDISAAAHPSGGVLGEDAGGTGPMYCCQEDGMVGLGCGARSYTRALHYSSEYAVGAGEVREILAEYVARPAGEFDTIQYGFRLDPEEQKRRYVIKSLLRVEGLDNRLYREYTGAGIWEGFPALARLVDDGLAEWDGERLQLTAAGLERSDLVGPWLYSPAVRRLSEEFDLR